MQNMTQFLDSIGASAGPAITGIVALVLIGAGLVIDLALWARVATAPPNWRAAIDRLRTRPWTLLDGQKILLILAASYMGLLVLLHALRHYQILDESRLEMLSIVLQTLTFDGAALSAVWLLLRRHGASWTAAFGNTDKRVKKHVLTGIMFYLGALPFVAVASLVYRAVLVGFGYEIEPQDILQLFIEPEYPLWIKIHLVGMAVVLAPLVEEILFRGILLPLLSRHARFSLALLFVSTLFAVIHFDLPSVVPLFVIAASFGAGYLYSGSLIVPIVMHALFNGVSLIALYFLKDTPAFTSFFLP